jgi:hypothetical protein
MVVLNIPIGFRQNKTFARNAEVILSGGYLPIIPVTGSFS